MGRVIHDAVLGGGDGHDWGRGCRSERREDPWMELTEPNTACNNNAGSIWCFLTVYEKVVHTPSYVVSLGMDCAASLNAPFSFRSW